MRAKKNIKYGFTILEMIVVMSLIGIVSGMILAGVQKGREHGQRAACGLQLSELHLMLTLYTEDITTRGQYPNIDTTSDAGDPTTFINALGDFGARTATVQGAAGSGNIYCTNRSIRSNMYIYDNGDIISGSGFFTPDRIESTGGNAAVTIHVFECRRGGNNPGPGGGGATWRPHSGRFLRLFGDGHVEAI